MDVKEQLSRLRVDGIWVVKDDGQAITALMSARSTGTYERDMEAAFW